MRGSGRALRRRVLKTALAFFSESVPGYASCFSRLRWRRRIAAEREIEIQGDDGAAEVFQAADLWVVVLDAAALPVGPSSFPSPAAGRVRLAATDVETEPPALHTLRELESSAVRLGEPHEGTGCAAVAFRTNDFPPAAGETVVAFLRRLREIPAAHERDSGFLAVSFDDSSERDRPELSGRIPPEARRLLDVGCGSGGVSAAVKSRSPGTLTTGVEKDPAAARRARTRLDRVLEGDAREILPRLAASGERYDAFLFADVLEHLEDPIHALALARELATPDATLVASVPNVGHLSLVRDLLLGRFDPIPAGLADAGHLRWFTRGFLAEALEEAGWLGISIESAAGLPAPKAQEFLAWLSGWPELDRESLLTYQWIAVAGNRESGDRFLGSSRD